MTPDERKKEWELEYQTRLGQICGREQPTPRDIEQARTEATEHVEAIESQESLERWRNKQ